MKLNASAQAKLYAMTALACGIWLIQSLYESTQDGSLTAWSTLVFSACLLVVILHSARQAVLGMKAVRKSQEEEDKPSDEER
ncbi:carbon starvation protein [Bifidobacterium sp.]|jgi:uncharacterized membrane protein|uniref:carbon starvation protein n=1 Tax=Bifidobacterium sp. TaxID=41200 RepID=UPI0025BD33D9|nr:carbon starvation protein [Bifidobacterium sp.]MCH4160150.1 carbon starvation protein [Bifidobacterium sp.]MCH4174380.1 carbon starvation protein [Bifidobacterium sp.]MCI1635789.1 carbon starvation protein [Bifidobacterium sp.]